MNLSNCPLARHIRVTAVSEADSALRRRLGELGLRTGAQVRVQRRTSGGGVIVAIGDDRLALARPVQRQIQVELCSAGAAA
ncbi:MAG: FeoA family protein [Candidatus Nanopelagicales bacterium]